VKRKSVVLLLTATIDPGSTPLVVRSDTSLRLYDYQEALAAWLRSDAARRIVFYENSGYDLSSLTAIATHYPGHEVEFLSTCNNQGGSSRGISRSLAQSKLVKESDIVVKCTGRLTVRNAAVVLESLSKCNFDVMCTLRKNLTFADTRLFAATPAFIAQYLIPQQEIIDDNKGVFLEHALACATTRALADRKTWLPFPHFPAIEGFSGTFGTSATIGPGSRLLKSLYHRTRNLFYSR
jgi:hypothetical protein